MKWNCFHCQRATCHMDQTWTDSNGSLDTYIDYTLLNNKLVIHRLLLDASKWIINVCFEKGTITGTVRNSSIVAAQCHSNSQTYSDKICQRWPHSKNYGLTTRLGIQPVDGREMVSRTINKSRRDLLCDRLVIQTRGPGLWYLLLIPQHMRELWVARYHAHVLRVHPQESLARRIQFVGCSYTLINIDLLLL
jgi:hypothetical protein